MQDLKLRQVTYKDPYCNRKDVKRKMETAIYVFSSTGTSLAAATRIAHELGNTVLYSIPNELKRAGKNRIKVEADRIGFLFPTYFGEIPDIVQNFIEKLNLDSAKYIFSVVTAGGNIGSSLRSLADRLNSKGAQLNYGTSIIVSSNYYVAWYYAAICAKGKRLKKALERLDNKSIQIAKEVSCQKNKVEKTKYIWSKIPKMISPKEIVRDTKPWDRDFSADEKCTGCGICYRVCPVQNITMANNKPKFQHNCQRCMACMQYCPNNAMRVGGKVLNKPKYFHPAFPAKEMMNFISS
jgi:Indolepyruvate ferredoxin oxidoreductase, alpha and beta subunits